MIHYITLIRPQQWAKNVLIFLPAFFGGAIFIDNNLYKLLLGFVAFSLVASSIYILNDYKDIEADKIHPKKKTRPLASGKVQPGIALGLMVLLIASGLFLAFTVNIKFFYLLAFYLVVNIGYCFGLKNIALLDIFIVASGFLIRAVSGGLIISLHISQWLVIMVFFGALFLALAKRRDDILMYINSGKVMRKSVRSYNLDFINSCLTMFSGVIIVAYLMYTISPEITSRMNSHHIYYTTIFVIAGIMRYLQITLVEANSGSPTKILYSDKFIILTIIGWLASFYVIIYLPSIF